VSREEWLAAYEALAPEAKRVVELFDAANMGEGSYAEADTARFDLNERYTELVHWAADLLKETA
jgi:hypothetical protein